MAISPFSITAMLLTVFFSSSVWNNSKITQHLDFDSIALYICECSVGLAGMYLMPVAVVEIKSNILSPCNSDFLF